MGLIRWLQSKFSRVVHPQQWLIDWITGGATASKSGISVSEDKALTYAAFYSAVDFIARGVAQLPWHVYERASNDGRIKAAAHPIYSLLHTRPCPEMTAFVWRQTMQGFVLTWGNAYAEIERNGAGRAVALWPVHPSKMEVIRRDGEIRYIQRNESGGIVADMSLEDVLHIRTLGGGMIGWSPVKLFRETIGMGLAAEQYGSTFFGNEARPSGILTHPGQLDPEAAKRLRAQWEQAHSGDKAHGTAVLEEGMTWTPVGIPNEDAQFLESRVFQIGEIARIFHIPPHKLAELTRATFSNIEHQAIEYVQDCLGPWLVNWEQEANYKLFMERERPKLYSEFMLDALLRGDTASRYNAYASAIQQGWMNRNEVRAKENLNPVEGLDEFLAPMNMTTAEKLAAAPVPEPAPTPEAKPDEDDDAKRVRLIEAHRPAILVLCQRIVTKEANAMRRAVETEDRFREHVAKFYHRHGDHIVEVLTPALVAYCAAIGADLPPDYAEKFARVHMASNRQALYGAYRDGVPDLLAKWEAELPAQMTERILEAL